MVKVKQSGFTLIELLIATTLLSMMIYLGSFAYAMFAKGWNTRLDGFNVTAADTRNFLLFRNVIQGTVPFIVNNKEKSAVVFFDGQADRVAGISKNGIFDAQVPVIYQLDYNPDSGTLRYSEVSADALLIQDFEQAVTFERSLTLLTGIEQASFGYFGWPSLADRHSANTVGAKVNRPAWFDDYSGDHRRLLPQLLQLTFTNKDGTETILKLQLSQGAEYVMSISALEND